MSSPEVEIFLPRFIKSNGPHLHLQSEIFTVPIVTTMVTTILLISPSSNGNDSLPPQQQQQQPERWAGPEADIVQRVHINTTVFSCTSRRRATTTAWHTAILKTWRRPSNLPHTTHRKRHTGSVIRARDVPDSRRSSRGGSRKEKKQVLLTKPIVLVCSNRGRNDGGHQQRQDGLFVRTWKAHHTMYRWWPRERLPLSATIRFNSTLQCSRCLGHLHPHNPEDEM